MKLWICLAPAIAFALGGCDFAPRYAPPQMSLPAKFKDAPSGGVGTVGQRVLVAELQGPRARQSRSASGRSESRPRGGGRRQRRRGRPGGAGSGGASPAGRRDRTGHRQQAIEQPAAAFGEPADVLRQQHSRRTGLVRDRHLGTRARPRQRGEPDGRGERGCARPGPARTARRTGPRLCRPARPRRAGKAHLRHDRNLPLRARSDQVPARRRRSHRRSTSIARRPN